MILASFPSPDRGVWNLGPVPIRAYALCIIAGIIAAIWLGERRWVARGGKRGTVSDIAVWAVIAGLVGGRLYHVITDNELYFREGRDPWRAFYVWEGGLGIWGAVALGGVGAWWACRQRGIKLAPFADTVAPGIVLAQAIGRWGNYFNQELFGRPTDLPWAVRIDPDRPSTVAGADAYHPAFLYESLWDLAVVGLLLWADRRFRMGRGRVFALYLMGYTVGRLWIELLRIDTANELFGLRINVWTSIVVFLGALTYFLLHRGPRETEVEPRTPTDPPTDSAESDSEDSDDSDDSEEDEENEEDDDEEKDADDSADEDADPTVTPTTTPAPIEAAAPAKSPAKSSAKARTGAAAKATPKAATKAAPAKAPATVADGTVADGAAATDGAAADPPAGTGDAPASDPTSPDPAGSRS